MRLSAADRSGMAATDDYHVGLLGDFRIIREVGRGGMGVVYEAEQVSLNRRVALKVLPFAATLDPRQLQRFKNEAQAAAQLHHTNMVPVHYVGCERGTHFYAMQFIDGVTLAAAIADLRLQIADLKKPD
ncbi:MAG: serine/threonine protein kinase, partial [Planctomycetes bacterium]|nr:serine/threonine protein kinase [Planctomycetota bacterium]